VADRESVLRLLVEFVSDKATAAAKLFRGEISETGPAADKAASGLTKAAEATNKLDSAQADAAKSAAQEAGALRAAGDAATETGARATEAARGSEQAIGEVVGAVDEQTRATEAAGEAATDAGQAIQDAAGRAAQSVNEIVDEWNETITAAKAAGLAFDDESAAGSIKELAAAIRASGDSLEQQKEALHGLAAGLAEDLAKIETASTGAGDETVAQAKSIRDALTEVRAKVVEVDAGLRLLGGAGAAGGEEAEQSFISVGASLRLANQAARDAETQLEKTGRVPKASIRELAEIIETVAIANERVKGTSDEATEEQLANVEQLKGKLRDLTEVTNRQTNAAGDNAVALKETGDQVNGLAGALTGLINVTGSGSTVFGTMVTKIGSGASAYERARDAVRALDVSTISATTKLGLMSAALVGGALAGKQFAEQTTENAGEIDRLTESIKKWLSTDVSSWVDGVNLSMQKEIEGLMDSETALASYLKLLTLVPLLHEKSGASIRFRTAAIRDGIDALVAEEVATKNGAKAWEFYQNSRRGGEEGQRLWHQAIEASKRGGDAFNKFLADNAKAMADHVAHTNRSADAIKKEADERARNTRLIAEEIGQRAALIEQQMAATAETNERVRRMIDENEVTNGATIAIRAKLAAIAEDITQSDVHSVSLARTAGALQEVLDAQDGLTRAERARIQDVINLAKRANDLTEAEQQYAAALIKAIETGNKHAAMLKARQTATADLTNAMREIADAEAISLRQRDEHVSAMQRELDLIREQIAEAERAQGIDRQQIAINQYEGASLDFLRMKEKQMREELESSLSVWNANAEAKKADVAESLRIIEESVKIEAAYARQREAIALVATSTNEYHKIVENGRVVWTNLTDEQRKNAEQAVENARANGRAKDGADALGTSLVTLRSYVSAVTLELDALNQKAHATAEDIDRVTEAVNKMNDAAAKAAEQ
jgi:hypothetical protein